MRGFPSGTRSLGLIGMSLSRLGMEVGRLASSTFHLRSGLSHGGRSGVEEGVSSLRLVDLLVVILSEVVVLPVVEVEKGGWREG